MRRALVLNDEARRHPFLATLPPHVRKPHAEEEAASWRLTRSDWRQFASTYAAGFVAVSAFIA
ncbi:MAG: hypothetical protein AB7F98_17645 [Novosphingobium sp.]